MDFTTGSSKLGLALKTLRLQWEETKTRWDDPVSRAFEEQHLVLLDEQVQTTLRGLDRLTGAFLQARQDCDS
jgi:hypothetical protein